MLTVKKQRDANIQQKNIAMRSNKHMGMRPQANTVGATGDSVGEMQPFNRFVPRTGPAAPPKFQQNNRLFVKFYNILLNSKI